MDSFLDDDGVINDSMSRNEAALLRTNDFIYVGSNSISNNFFDIFIYCVP